MTEFKIKYMYMLSMQIVSNFLENFKTLKFFYGIKEGTI